jgi:hypothetical protein
MSDGIDERLRAAHACLKWIDENGGDTTLFKDGSVEFRESESGGMGLFAKRSIRENERLIFVPPECELTWETASKNPFLERVGNAVIQKYAGVKHETVEEGTPPYFEEDTVRMYAIVFLLRLCHSSEGDTESKSNVQLKKAIHEFRHFFATLPKSFGDGVLLLNDNAFAHITGTPLHRNVTTF